MRSKVIVWAYLIVLSLGTMLSLYMPKTEAAAKESIVIPGEAIRLRILANSDFDSDQAIKRKVRDAVNAQITLWVQDLTSMEKARTAIKEKLPEIKAIAEKVVHEQGSNQTVKVQFGKVQFPTKLYGQFLYPAGEYQAVLITLGKGEGANWWCVLYPPLCFLDFSNGVAVSQGFNEKAQAAVNDSDSSDSQDAAAPAVKTAKDQPQTETTDKQSGDSVAAARQNQKQDKDAEDRPAQDPKAANEQGTEDQSTQKAANEQGTENQTTQKAANEQGTEEQSTQNAAYEGDSEDQLSSRIARKTDLEDQSGSNQAIETTAGEHQAEQKTAKKEKQAPVYTAEDEQPVKVKFFIVELWQKLFD
jgi:stage II sporulation protein R